MVDRLLGHWKLDQSENMDEYMIANNINIVLRTIGNTITANEEIRRVGNQWTINMTSTFKSTSLVFNLAQPFRENTVDGRTMMSTFNIEGDRLVQRQDPVNEGDLPSTFTREILEDGRLLVAQTSRTPTDHNTSVKQI